MLFTADAVSADQELEMDYKFVLRLGWLLLESILCAAFFSNSGFCVDLDASMALQSCNLKFYSHIRCVVHSPRMPFVTTLYATSRIEIM